MYDPQSTSAGSIMPRYQWLIKNKQDFSSTEDKMRAMVSLGVPYTDEDIANAQQSIKEQSKMIEENLYQDPDIKSSFEEEKRDFGAEYVPLKDREIVALIAYLQRLGTDIKVVDIKDQLTLKE